MRQRPGTQSRIDAVPGAQPGEGQGRRPVARPDPQHGLLLAADRGLIQHPGPERRGRSRDTPLRPPAAAAKRVTASSVNERCSGPTFGRQREITENRRTEHRGPPDRQARAHRTVITRWWKPDSFSPSQATMTKYGSADGSDQRYDDRRRFA